jgi:hypothetical protein
MEQKKYIRCKACGFVMLEGDLKHLCPACGLPKTVFEPYSKKISPLRKFLLDQHLHPIAVHFPQVFVFVIIAGLLLSYWVPEPWRSDFLSAAKLSILGLPFAVLAGFISGLIDGRLRFKKLNAPLLIHKIVAGIVFQLLSLIIAGIYLATGFTPASTAAIIVLSIISTAIAIYLGRTGATMFESFIPG